MMLFLLSIISFGLHYFTRDNVTLETLYTDWWYWFKALLQGEYGISRINHQPIAPQVCRFFPATLELTVITFFMTLIIGVPIGVVAGIINNKRLSQWINALVQLGVSLPIFCSGLMFSLVFAITLHWFPIPGHHEILPSIKPITGFFLVDAWLDTNQQREPIIASIINYMVLPICTLTIIPAAEIIHLMHENTTKVMNQTYIKVAAMRGISRGRILYRHVLRNVLPTLIPHIGLQFSSILTLTLITEPIFNWPGAGKWLINAVHWRDFDAISVIVMVSGSLIILINMFANVLTILFDPIKRRGWYAG